MVSPCKLGPGDERGTTTGRRRDAEASKAAILRAARSAFAELGYARATIREVALRAGVTHGLVMKHFTSKEQLFVAAMPGASDLAGLLPSTPDAVPRRVAEAYVARMESAGRDDPFLAVIRSAATDTRVAQELYEAMRARSLEAYERLLGGPEIAQRVELLGAHLLGVTFSRYVLRTGALAEMPAARLVEHLARTLQVILEPLEAPDDGLGAAPRSG